MRLLCETWHCSLSLSDNKCPKRPKLKTFFTVACDPGRHLQECPGARAGFFQCFSARLGLTLWGTPSQVPKSTQKTLRGALSDMPH